MSDNHTHVSNQSGHSSHGHSHDVSSLSGVRLLLVIIFNLAISVAELIGGLVSGSLSLTSDAMHNFSDTASIIFSYVSLRVSARPKNNSKTYGYKRANILAAFVNSAVLIAIAIYLLAAAFRKFIHPTEVAGNLVIIVALIGLAGNLLSVLVLRKSAQHNINIKSSFLHLLSDTLSSVAVVIAGVIIRLTAAYWVDPVFSILINLFIIYSAFRVLRESVGILMQSAPVDADIDRITERIASVDGVVGAHHLHIWRLDENDTMLEAHVCVEDVLVSKTAPLRQTINTLLENECGISHTVIQFESENTCGRECNLK